MEWTREKRYLPYSKWDADTLMHLQSQAARSNYQMRYHLRPISGLVNDPNGFSYFNGEYHVFYQSYPFGAVHGLKSWVHFKSKDLVHWLNLGLAIEPSFKGDSHGAYSGSAKQIGDQLFIMYTGNHREENWDRIPYQIGAWMDKNGNVHDKQILFRNPDHITEHFRDPQILEQNGTYYAILGAQNKADKEGKIDVWKSANLKDWEEVGYLDFTDQSMGYMIECPNLVQVDDKWVLIFCPQGLDKKVCDYQNIYPNMYVIADDLDLEHAKLINPGQLHNLDEGFDVYASQAFNAPDGQAFEISWVGLPDTTYPTDQENWANCLSQVKKLKIKNGQLKQQPVKGFNSLHQASKPIAEQTNTNNQYELDLVIKPGQSGSLHLAAKHDLSQELEVKYDTAKGSLSVSRQRTEPVSPDFGFQRSTKFAAGQELKLKIFIDHSLFEIFVNDGEHVLTGRFFANEDSNQILLNPDQLATATLYSMDSIL